MKRSPRKSATQWAALVTEYETGSESEIDFCRRHKLKLVTLRKWRYHYKGQDEKGSRRPSAAFVKVNVKRSTATQEAAVLCIGEDIRLECPASYDVSSLAQLALAVHHGR